MQIGRISVTRIQEMVTPFMTPAEMFPDAPAAAFAKHRHWLQPDILCPQTGKIIIAIQTYIIRTPEHTILVDTCIGCDKTNHFFPEWHQRSDARWLDRLVAAGIHPDEVDYVFCTHLHGDHCGWNTRLVDGRWVPTFANATYIISAREISHARDAAAPAWEESVLPIVETGQVLAVPEDYVLNEYVHLQPTTGHTPGHVAVHIHDGEQAAVLSGDLIHCPIQCLYPDWHYWIDHDPVQAVNTRKAFLQACAESGRLVLTAHFPGSSKGFVEPSGDAWRFRFTSW